MTVENISLSEELKSAIEAAKLAGKVILQHFNSDRLIFRDKGKGDLQTEVDVLAAKKIFDVLRSRYSEYSFYCEDFPTDVSNRKGKKTWVVDPLDGTVNFYMGVPYFSSAVSLIQDDEILLSVIHNPITRDTYYAEKGKGAFLNGNKLVIEKKAPFRRQIISLICGYSSRKLLRMVNRGIGHNFFRVIDSWAPSLDYCLLARGKIDSIISLNSEIEDQIGGILIAKEAGAVVKDVHGNNFKPFFSKILPFIIISKSEKSCVCLLHDLRTAHLINSEENAL